MPSYSTNDPKGWCGDKRRGAALGRTPICNGPPIGAINLAPVHLDEGGYDRNGTYFGHGAPLFWYADDGGNIDACERASDVDVMAERLRERFPEVEVKFCRAIKAKCYGAGDDPCPDDADAQDSSAYCGECEIEQWKL